MKRQVIAVIIGSLFALPALADSGAAKTSHEVLAELIQAERTGDVVANAETGQKAYQLYPSAYSARTVTAGKSRNEVLHELVEAERKGEVIANAETGTLAKDL